MMNNHVIKAIIIDDEENARENLRGILNEYCPEVQILKEASSAAEAIVVIDNYKPNLVFLDIEMPDGNGFEVLKQFKNPEFKVIFVTAYDHYAIQAIRFSALDYILKPINVLFLQTAIQKMKETMEKDDLRIQNLLENNVSNIENRKLALTFSNKIEYIEIKQILRCEGETNYTRFYLNDGRKFLISRTLVEYEEILDNHGFIRSHKSHLVNIKHIRSFIKDDGGYLVMQDGSTVPVSRRKKEAVLEKLNPDLSLGGKA